MSRLVPLLALCTCLCLPACARSVRPILPPSAQVDVLRRGAEVPLETYIDLVRRAVTDAGWTIDRSEDERTGGRISHTTLWVSRVREDPATTVKVRLDVRDGMYQIITTASEGLPREDADWVLVLDETIRGALGIDYSGSGDAEGVGWSP